MKSFRVQLWNINLSKTIKKKSEHQEEGLYPSCHKSQTWLGDATISKLDRSCLPKLVYQVLRYHC